MKMSSNGSNMESLQILNKSCNVSDVGKVESERDVSGRLQKLMLQIKGEFMSEEGKEVNYEALRKSALFLRYTEECLGLHGVDLGTLSEVERTAFCINIYNALTIHGICESGVPTSVLGVKHFWRTMAYYIGKHVFTLDDIEHGILRGNRPHPSSPSPLFSDDDPRLQYALSNVDPRIHFTLVCGAKSCPAINVYSAKNLERGLKAATENFCCQAVDIDVKAKQVKLSKLFLWYKSDFGQNDEELLRWILPHLSGQTYEDLNLLLNHSKTSEISVGYSDYNWNLNSFSTSI